MYKVVFLPIAKQDLASAVDYIENDLDSKAAAARLYTDIMKAIKGLRDFPYAHKLFESNIKLKNTYRMLIVRNYIVYYIVDEKKKSAEIYRIRYGKMDQSGNFLE